LLVKIVGMLDLVFFFSSRRRHTRSYGDWSSDVCSSDLVVRSRAVPESGQILVGQRRVDERIVPGIMAGHPIPDNGRKLSDLKTRSEERRVGKECRTRRSADQ